MRQRYIRVILRMIWRFKQYKNVISFVNIFIQSLYKTETILHYFLYNLQSNILYCGEFMQNMHAYIIRFIKDLSKLS